MKAKLIKERFDFYGLKVDDKIIATNDVEVNKMFNYPHNISLKNCQTIELGYDLDELINQFYMSDNKHKASIYSFKKGFQKALEILGDKKFSEEDMHEAIRKAKSHDKTPNHEDIIVSFNYSKEEIIQSLQQTEWDVEIETLDYFTKNEKVYIDEIGKGNYSTHSKVPKLDSDGCLILKRAI